MTFTTAEPRITTTVLRAVGGATSKGEYPAYAWPGGYELGYVTDDGGLLCAACTNQEPEASEDAIEGSGWRVVAWTCEDRDNASERDGEIQHCDNCARVWPDSDEEVTS